MRTRSTESLVERCRGKVKRRFDLDRKPKIEIAVVKFKGPDTRGRYSLPKDYQISNEFGELFHNEDYQPFNNVLWQLKNQNYRLHRVANRDIPYEVYLIEPRVHLGEVTIAAGYNFIVMGVVQCTGKKYAVIMEVSVRRMMRHCGFMTLMKHEEITLAKNNQCDFIQTYHWSKNPNFVAAIAPGLAEGFVLYHGKSGGGEYYEEHECVHLRYYFDRKVKNVRVWFKDGTEFKSPRGNQEIIEHLVKINKTNPLPGTQIKKIEMGN